MLEFITLLDALNNEKREMEKHGTQYRKDTAILASEIVFKLASLNYEKPLTQVNLLLFIYSTYSIDEERANDVTKAILTQVSRVNDQERLADYYQDAQKKLNER